MRPVTTLMRYHENRDGDLQICDVSANAFIQGVFSSELTSDSLSGSPDFLGINLIELFAEILVVGFAAVELQGGTTSQRMARALLYANSPQEIGESRNHPLRTGREPQRRACWQRGTWVPCSERSSFSQARKTVESSVTDQSRAPRRAVVEHA